MAERKMGDGVDLDAVERLALSASQGDWSYRKRGDLPGFVEVRDASSAMPYGLELLCDDYKGFGDDEQRELDCQFVAALGPSVVLSMILELKELRAHKESIPELKKAKP